MGDEPPVRTVLDWVYLALTVASTTTLQYVFFFLNGTYCEYSQQDLLIEVLCRLIYPLVN